MLSYGNTKAGRGTSGGWTLRWYDGFGPRGMPRSKLGIWAESWDLHLACFGLDDRPLKDLRDLLKAQYRGVPELAPNRTRSSGGARGRRCSGVERGPSKGLKRQGFFCYSYDGRV